MERRSMTELEDIPCNRASGFQMDEMTGPDM